ncbi:MAG: arsenate reductase ArsC [Elusimicrobiota bacterium]
MKILILCAGNSCRSQMAEVIFNQVGNGHSEAFSAGSSPSGFVHPLAIRVLAEGGYSIIGLRSKHLGEFQGRRFDRVITVCDAAKEACPAWPGAKIIHWDFKDPASAAGSDEEKIRVFRAVFNSIERHVRGFFGLH